MHGGNVEHQAQGVPLADSRARGTGADRPASAARRWRVLAVTSVAVFMALLDVTIVNIAVPDIRRSYAGDTLGDLSWILNGYNIVFAAALAPAGRLADRVGRKRMFICGVLVFLAASALCAIALGRVRARQVYSLSEPSNLRATPKPGQTPA